MNSRTMNRDRPKAQGMSEAVSRSGLSMFPRLAFSRNDKIEPGAILDGGRRV
jgi:hypothetical protein